MASASVEAVYQATTENRRDELVASFLDKISASLEADKTTIGFNFAPLRYELDESKRFLARVVNLINNEPGRWPRIKDIFFTYRLGRDQKEDLDQLIAVSKANNNKFGLAIGGVPLADGVGEALEAVRSNSFAGEVIVHCGLQKEESEMGPYLGKVMEHLKGGGKLTLNLDGDFKWFVNWCESGQNMAEIRAFMANRQLKLKTAPLSNIIENPGEIDSWEDLIGKFPEAERVTNNSRALLGGVGSSFVQIV